MVKIMLTKLEVTRELCAVMGLVYRAQDDYSHANDGICDRCDKAAKEFRESSVGQFGALLLLELKGDSTFAGYRNEGIVLQYIRDAVLEKLRKDGYEIPAGFDPVTGKDVSTYGD